MRNWLGLPATTVTEILRLVIISCIGAVQARSHDAPQNRAPKYLVDCCVPVFDVATRHHTLRQSTSLDCAASTFGRQAFSVGARRPARRSPRPRRAVSVTSGEC